jgi:integrase
MWLAYLQACPPDVDTMKAAAKVVRPDDYPNWQRLIKGLLLTGLRIGEAVSLSWDEDAGIWIDMTDIPAIFRFAAMSQKNNQETEVAMLEDAEDFFARTPVEKRTGWVFDLRSRFTCKGNVKRDDASKVLSKIGKVAGVITKGNPRKYFSAHDCRATFATRLANRGVDPYDVMQLMRHSEIQTTLKYYVRKQAKDVRDRIDRQRIKSERPVSAAGFQQLTENLTD